VLKYVTLVYRDIYIYTYIYILNYLYEGNEENNVTLFTISKNQQMHYVIKYSSISPTYVSAPVEPSWLPKNGLSLT
jgi:hypothetical protein